ncbi:MFS transporter [Methanoplanus endosymbiosus]|uniref:MFS transporter n=1 Tax=Methanoplanus endosymbiosus TaxID=33865 RepID=A0A9E7PTC4_9EURY|nr:MFS transporter [Methanoplanus endosymbiosus]UUX93532.1 MFS transporter [Methanoplanus endosymbiosus]
MNNGPGKYFGNETLLLAVISIGVFMDGLDGAIVNVSLPQIAQDFGAEIELVSLVVTAYLIFLSGLMITFGKLASYKGAKKIYIAGILLFTVSSLLCALSTGIEMLIIFRSLQGIGAAMIAPTAIGIVAKEIPEERRGKSLGILVAASSFAFALGPVAGGFLTEYLSWHWIFLINLPIGIAAAALSLKFIPGSENIPGDKHRNKESFDYAGSLLFLISVGILITTLGMAGDAGPLSPSVIISLAVCAALFYLFYRREKSASNPVLEISIFRIPEFNSSTATYMLIMGAFGGAVLILPFYFQYIRLWSPAMAGLALLIPSVMITIFSPLGGMAADRYGARVVCIIAGILATAGFLLTACYSGNSPLIFIAATLLLLGVGCGPVMSAGASGIISSAPAEKKEIASGIMSTSVYLGTAIGTAVFTAIFSLFTKTAGSSMNPGAEIFMEGFFACFIAGTVFCLTATLLAYTQKAKKMT